MDSMHKNQDYIRHRSSGVVISAVTKRDNSHSSSIIVLSNYFLDVTKNQPFLQGLKVQTPKLTQTVTE